MGRVKAKSWGIGENQIIQGFEDHCENFGFHFEYNGKPLGFEQNDI